MNAVTGARSADYGLDAPGLVRMFFLLGIAATAASLLGVAFLPTARLWAIILVSVLGIVALYTLGMGCFMIYGSRVMKVRECDRLLDAIPWRGDEQVLDVGCGRGLMLVKAAKRLTTGKTTGVDIWQVEDQATNSRDATLDNAGIEGVAHRVDVETADMRALPFSDASFDMVVSNWVVHNLPAESDRNRALGEMSRVLRPDGTLILSDIARRGEYRATLARLGLTDQRIVVNAINVRFLAAITFGSFRPSAIIARRPS